MFPKGKATSVPSDSQAKEKLANHVYEYLVHNGATKAAQSFLQEIHWDKPWQLGEAPGFLNQWWCVFYDLYNAAPERRESFEHSSEAKAFHDYGFVNSGYPNGLPRNPSIPSPISGGMPPTGGRPPSSQGIIPPDNNIHTPVSIQGGPMMVPGGPFFAPGHPMSNIGGQTIDMMRTRAVLHQSLRFPQGPMMASYHPTGGMPRHRFLGNSAPPIGIAHSPGPSSTPQTGPQIMPSPNDSLQNELQQNNSGQDPFGPNGSSRSPSHVISQPAPAFPPPPASESNADQQNPTGMMNGGSQMPQFSQHQSHTMEYMPSSGMNFEPPVSMKHSPQLHNPNINEVIATMGNNIADFCNQIPQNGPPFTSDHAMRVSQSSVQMGVQPINQLHMMQQGLASHHMQSMPGGPTNPAQFISHPGGPINASPQFPDYAFTSMSQAI